MKLRKVCRGCLIAFLIMVVAVGAALSLLAYFGPKRAYFYEGANVGEPFSPDGWEPHGRVKWRHCTVWYYFGWKPFAQTVPLPKEVNELSELPFAYDARQFLVAPDGRLLAKGWCGETTLVITVSGVFEGSDLSILKNLSFGGPP